MTTKYITLIEFLRDLADRLEKGNYVEKFNIGHRQGLYRYYDLSDDCVSHVPSGKHILTIDYELSGFPKPSAYSCEEILP
jgi:hypothetical protein